MHTLIQEIRVSDIDAPLEIHATGDWHVGEIGHAASHLARDINLIADKPNALVLLMGDLGSFIVPHDKRWNPKEIAETLEVRDLANWGDTIAQMIVNTAEPIKSKIIGSLEGNHEFHYCSRTHSDVAKHIAESLETSYIGYAALITLKIVSSKFSRTIKIHATHGSGCAKTQASKLKKLMDTIKITDADLTLLGHVHCIQDAWSVRLVQRHDEIVEHKQFGVITGCYLKTYHHGSSGYGEMAGYDPTVLGHPVITIIPRSGKMSVGVCD